MKDALAEGDQPLETKTIVTGVAVPAPLPMLEKLLAGAPPAWMEAARPAPQAQPLPELKLEPLPIPAPQPAADAPIPLETIEPLIAAEPAAPPAAAEIAAAPTKLAFAARLTPQAVEEPAPAAAISKPDAAPPAAVEPEPAPAPVAESSHLADRHTEADTGERSASQKPEPPKLDAAPAAPAQNLEPVAPAASPLREQPIQPPARAPEPTHAEPTRRAELEPAQPVAARAPEAHAISLRVADGPTDRVELKITDRAGEVRVAVRTTDANLAGSLRANLGELVHHLEQSGFKADTWHPLQTNAIDSGSGPIHAGRRAESESWNGNHSGGSPQQHADGGGNGRHREQDPQRARWIAELENNLAPQPERNLPTWPPSSIR